MTVGEFGIDFTSYGRGRAEYHRFCSIIFEPMVAALGSQPIPALTKPPRMEPKSRPPFDDRTPGTFSQRDLPRLSVTPRETRKIELMRVLVANWRRARFGGAVVSN